MQGDDEGGWRHQVTRYGWMAVLACGAAACFFVTPPEHLGRVVFATLAWIAVVWVVLGMRLLRGHRTRNR